MAPCSNVLGRSWGGMVKGQAKFFICSLHISLSLSIHHVAAIHTSAKFISAASIYHFHFSTNHFAAITLHSSSSLTTVTTNSQIRDTVLCRSVTKNLTDYRFNSAGWGLDDMKAEIHSFPTMYIIGGGKWGRNGSKLRFSQKKWPKNSFFEGHKSGSTDFGGV